MRIDELVLKAKNFNNLKSNFHKMGNENVNIGIMDTFDEAVFSEPDAHPLFHSDRGFQYTSPAFCNHLKKHPMKQSISRVAYCVDNDPMEFHELTLQAA